MLAGFDLHIVHEGFAFKCSPGSPHVSRMDAICAIAVAYMWESSTVREDGRLRVFFSGGVLTLDARLRNAPPKGKRATHASPFRKQRAVSRKERQSADTSLSNPSGLPSGVSRNRAVYTLF